ncbi:MAG: thioredoxin family protein [Ferrovum sp.]|nr:thioredoxin family protein [Ferrovum sp.]
MSIPYAAPGPTLTEVEVLEEPTVLEFGAPWCSYCRAAQPLLAAGLVRHPRVRLIRVEDGRGRPLGRFFQVKLWPTFIFLNQGKEAARLVRPNDQAEIGRALARIDSE